MQQMPCCGHKVNININKKRQKRQHISTALTIYCSQATATALLPLRQLAVASGNRANGQPASLVDCKAISLWHKQRHNFDLIARYSLKNKLHVVATCGKWPRAGVAQKLRNFDVQRPVEDVVAVVVVVIVVCPRNVSVLLGYGVPGAH